MPFIFIASGMGNQKNFNLLILFAKLCALCALCAFAVNNCFFQADIK
jgi:hypothetical protein